MADLTPNCSARVLRGRYHGHSLVGHVVDVVREDAEFAGFWWCIWNDNRHQQLVRREILLHHGQLQKLEKGGADAAH